jgi:hypothetical protein
MSFSDLLKKPLPSKLAEEKVATESAEEKEEPAEVAVEESNEEDVQKLDAATDELASTNTEMKLEDSDEELDEIDDDDLEDIDLSGLSDEELDEIEDELRDSDLDDAAGDLDPVELSPEEEREADDLMSLAGTTELLRSELNAEERAQFMESFRDTQIAVFEGFLLESDIAPSSEEDDVMTEAKMYNHTSVRLSKEDRKRQLYAVALNVSARAHEDPDYIKLQKVQKMRRILKRKIQKKYHQEAIKRMKVYFNRLKSSKSSILASIGKKISGDKD